MMLSIHRALVVGLLGLAAGCGDLNVPNVNAPERERAFSDPATIAAAAAGTMKTWINTRYAGDPSITLSTMADAMSTSWNNWNARYYSSYSVDCPKRCGWVNSTATQLGTQVQPYWYGMYSVISSANDVLWALRLSDNPPELNADRDRVETIAQMGQAMGHAYIALNYDRGFLVEESVRTPEQLAALTLQTRQALRDKAMEQFERAYTLANTKTFSTGSNWFGTASSPVYTSKQLAKAIRTMQAELLAHFPRSAEENAQVNWGQVASLAAQGVSSTTNGPAFDFEAYQDANFDFISVYHTWMNDFTTTRVDTRVARLLSDTQRDPWPGGVGNPQPVDAAGNPIGGVYGVDRRVGDGCFGPSDDFVGNGGCAATSRSGTDFSWSPLAIFIPGRGAFHQSNMGYTRHHCLTVAYPDCPSGAGLMPVYPRVFNDLLWAEGLIRSNGSRSLAAERINATRVGRGGLAPLTGSESDQQLLRALIYEQEVELLQVAPAAYYNRRRLTTAAQTAVPEAFNSLWPDTPRQMPIPAKDLQLLQMEIYSFGGPGNPTGLAPSFGGSSVRSVRDIWAEFERHGRAEVRARRRR